MIESAMAVRFPAGANYLSYPGLAHYRPIWNSDEVTGIHVPLGQYFRSGCFSTAWNGFRRFNDESLSRRRNIKKNKTRATAEHLSSASDPLKQNGKSHYHPFEDIVESTSTNSGDAILTPAETSRTIIEVNSKAMLMLTGPINDDVHENLIWPDLPYVTDEHGNVYFSVKHDEDILQNFTSDHNFVQIIVGFDALEMMKEMELSGSSEIDFGIEDIDDENSDVEDDEDDDENDEDNDYEEDWVAVLEDEDDQYDSDGSPGNWANLETMRYSHPMYFAKRLTEVASDDPIDWMEQPPAGLAIQGLLKPVLLEEHSDIQSHIAGHQSCNADVNITEKVVEEKLENLDMINGDRHESESSEDGLIWAEETEKDGNRRIGTTFYKLEIFKIQLITAHGHQTIVEVEDFRRAKPDAIAHSAVKIIARLKAAGEKTTQAFKSLCWRLKGIQVEEAAVIGVDSLGFDLRVCSGRQIQTLRFAFNTRATSEYSAERQLNELLFPRTQHKPQKKKQTHQNEF